MVSEDHINENNKFKLNKENFYTEDNNKTFYALDDEYFTSILYKNE